MSDDMWECGWRDEYNIDPLQPSPLPTRVKIAALVGAFGAVVVALVCGVTARIKSAR